MKSNLVEKITEIKVLKDMLKSTKTMIKVKNSELTRYKKENFKIKIKLKKSNDKIFKIHKQSLLKME